MNEVIAALIAAMEVREKTSVFQALTEEEFERLPKKYQKLIQEAADLFVLAMAIKNQLITRAEMQRQIACN